MDMTILGRATCALQLDGEGAQGVDEIKRTAAHDGDVSWGIIPPVICRVFAESDDTLSDLSISLIQIKDARRPWVHAALITYQPWRAS